MIRNEYEDWVWGFNAKFTALSPLHSEIIALYLGIKMAKKIKCYNIIVATDSTTLDSSLSDDAATNNNLLIMCMNLLRELGITSIRHEDRRLNGVAGVLAKEGRKK